MGFSVADMDSITDDLYHALVEINAAWHDHGPSIRATSLHLEFPRAYLHLTLLAQPKPQEPEPSPWDDISDEEIIAELERRMEARRG